MPVSLDFLVQRTNCLIQAKSQPTMQQMAEIAGIINAVNTAAVFSTSSSAVLPSPNVNKGRFVYLNDKRGYVYSDGISWTDNVCTVTSATSSLWSWGLNTEGALGDGTIISKCSPVREYCSGSDWCIVSNGNRSTHAIKTSGELWSWGLNTCGQLGIGDVLYTSEALIPLREFCSATDWSFINSHPCSCYVNAIKTNGQLWGWGSNGNGQLGDGTNIEKCSPVREFCSASDWCKVSSGGSFHAAAIKTNGELWTWGRNSTGQLGDGTTILKCSPVREFCSATDWCQVSSGLFFTTAIKSNGQLWSWGCNNQAQLGDGTIISKCSPVREFCSATDWCQVSSGNCHNLGLKFSGELWVWGNNAVGQLGIGSTVISCSPIREFCSATDWCKVSSGTLHSLALKTSGQLWAWGNNSSNNLGDGTTNNRCSPIREFCSATDWCQIAAGSSSSHAIKRSRGFNSV